MDASTPTPVGQILTELALADPTRPAVTCEERTVSFGELERRANRLARAYAARGVGQDDLVVLALPNGIEFYEATFALWKLGAVPVPVSWRLPESEREEIVALAAPALVIGAEARARPWVRPGFEPDAALDDGPLPVRTPPRLKVGTSGGSTGRPKLIAAGVPGALSPNSGRMLRMQPHQPHLVAGPLYHGAPFGWSVLGLLMGQHLVVLPKFDPRAALTAITQHRIGWLNLVPTTLLRMLRELEVHPDAYDLSSLEVVYHAAAPCPAWLKERWIEIVGPERLVEVYATAEGLAATEITGTEWLQRRGSVGRAVRGEVAIIDDAGAVVAPGVQGNVSMRASPDAEGTYEYVGQQRVVHDGGWETFGDVGWMDADGYLYLAGRSDDMIISGGANVYPEEVEAAILAHPRVLSCAVVGLPDDDLGERVHALVEVDGPVADDELASFVQTRLARTKSPRTYRFVTEPLRDEAGKLRRRALRQREINQLEDKAHR